MNPYSIILHPLQQKECNNYRYANMKKPWQPSSKTKNDHIIFLRWQLRSMSLCLCQTQTPWRNSCMRIHGKPSPKEKLFRSQQGNKIILNTVNTQPFHSLSLSLSLSPTHSRIKDWTVNESNAKGPRTTEDARANNSNISRIQQILKDQLTNKNSRTQCRFGDRQTTEDSRA